MANGSPTALLAFSASTAPSHLPVCGEASSRLTTSKQKPPAAPPASETARSTPFFMPVPSGSIAPCMGHDVYRRSLPLGHCWASAGVEKAALPRRAAVRARMRVTLMTGLLIGGKIGTRVELAGMRLWLPLGCQRPRDLPAGAGAREERPRGVTPRDLRAETRVPAGGRPRLLRAPRPRH